MNVLERLCMSLDREFPTATIILFSPDDQDNATWSISVQQGDDVLTIQWHRGLPLLGVSQSLLPGSLPDELLPVTMATERVRQVVKHRALRV
jgi:hypothetical protein